MDSVKSEPIDDSVKSSVRGHSRSKSQTLIVNGAINDELMKHFQRSLSEHPVKPNHAKSKSLPRPMRGNRDSCLFFH